MLAAAGWLAGWFGVHGGSRSSNSWFPCCFLLLPPMAVCWKPGQPDAILLKLWPSSLVVGYEPGDCLASLLSFCDTFLPIKSLSKVSHSTCVSTTVEFWIVRQS